MYFNLFIGMEPLGAFLLLAKPNAVTRGFFSSKWTEDSISST